MKINKTWNKRDLEGTDGIVHFRYIKTVEVYCKFFFKCSKSGWQKKIQTFFSGVFENMCPACFWRLLPLISKSCWNKEMRITGKPSKPIGLWSLSTRCFKPFMEICISVQFRSQMEFFHWIQTASQTTVQFVLAQDWNSGRDKIHYWGAWVRSLSEARSPPTHALSCLESVLQVPNFYRCSSSPNLLQWTLLD